MDPASEEALVAMGLSALEAQAYAWLLRHGAASAYGVAKGLGKPTANTYKAIDSLLHKGALLHEEGAGREVRAVPPEEFLGALERRFRARLARAAAGLERLAPPAADERVWRLGDADQVRERLRAMLAAARRVCVVDLFPPAVEALRAPLEEAARRGVVVAAKVYAPCELLGVRVVLEPRAAEVSARWPGQWSNAVVDGHEHLLAWLSADGRRVRQAVWSPSPFLSWIYHTGLVRELWTSAMERALAEGAAREELVALAASFEDLRAEDAPGYRALRAREAEESRAESAGASPR